jgi:hypothetical protein
MQWQDINKSLHTLEKTQGGFTLAHRGIVTMPDGMRVFVKIGVDETTNHWIQREINMYELLAAHFYPSVPKLLTYNDDHTAFALEALDSDEGWDWTNAWDTRRLDKTLEAVDLLANITPTKANKKILGKGMLGANNDGWKALTESMAKQKVLLAKLHTVGHDELANRLNIPVMADQSAQFVFKDDMIVHYDVRADNCAWNSKLNTVKLIDWNWAQLGDRRIDVGAMLVDVHRAGFDIMGHYANRLDATALQWLAEFRFNAASSPVVPGMGEQVYLRDYQLESGITALILSERLLNTH